MIPAFLDYDPHLVPVVFLSSASDNMNIVMAMNMGGDDFIPKPVDPDVLTAKIHVVLRRSYVEENTLTVNVTRLRKKLESVGLSDFIRTRVGSGYIVECGGKHEGRNGLFPPPALSVGAALAGSALCPVCGRLRPGLRAVWAAPGRRGLPRSAVSASGALVLALRFRGWCKRHRERRETLKSIEQNYAALPPGDTLAEEDYRQLLLALGKINDANRTESRSREQESLDYYSTWVHQIKTPISVMRMISRGEDTDEHCAEIDAAARNRIDAMLPRLAETAGATEERKARGPLKWGA